MLGKNSVSLWVQSLVYAYAFTNLLIFSWENGKLLLTRENFIQELIFYDKDNIPEDMFLELSKLVEEPLFQPDLVESVSKAAMGICLWVHSIQKYSYIHRNMQPRLKNLMEQEEKFTRVRSTHTHSSNLMTAANSLEQSHIMCTFEP